ncbi:hypothetical protein [Belnapia rosea]|nr:hypothetical protein [Belnapia rosea]
MARSNKLSGQKAPEEPVERLLETILDDVLRATAMTSDEWRALSQFPLVPLAIPVGLGREYRVTQAGVDAAHRLTEQIWRKQENYRQTVARPEFNRLSFQAIGETIQNCRSHLPSDVGDDGNTTVGDLFFAAMAADFVRNLDRLADAARPDVDRHIPCHLFHTSQGVPLFSVGPVELLPRANWIARYVKNADQLGHIRQVESGQIRYDQLRDQAHERNSDRELHTAWQVLSALRNFEWVATIRMQGHELSQSHYKASIIIGLVLDAIGLRFQAEDARRFTKAGRQHLFAEDRLATSADGSFLKGTSVQMPGLGSAPGALAAKMQAERPFLDAVGKVLHAYVAGRQTGRGPHLVERWANALYWVGEARREASDFMAVVKYGCAADGLSGAGGDAVAMTTFAEAALNPKAQAATQGSISIADAVTKVYRDGRNKLAHGEMAGLFEDLSGTRAIGDALLVALFDEVTFELAAVIEQRPEILTLSEKHAYRALEARLKQRP